MYADSLEAAGSHRLVEAEEAAGAEEVEGELVGRACIRVDMWVCDCGGGGGGGGVGESEGREVSEVSELNGSF